MAFKLMVVSVCMMLSVAALNLTGCAQFEDSFGQLRGPDNQSANVVASPNDDSLRSNDRRYRGPYSERTGAPSNEGSYSLAGLQVELNPGKATQ